jgi:ABC-type transporter Mla subunit MlaD
MNERDNARLGAFLVITLAAAVGFALFFLEQYRDRPSLKGVTYFDEPIGNLRADAPVRYRGDDIGRVESIHLDPDNTYIRVEFEVYIDALPEWETDALRESVENIDPLLRAQIATAGLIGDSFLQVDRLDEPPPALVIERLPPGRHYLPSRSSDFESLIRKTQDSLTRLPDLLDRVDRLVLTVDTKVQAVDVEQLQARVDGLLGTGEQTLARLNTVIDDYFADEGPVADLLLATTDAARGVERHLAEGGSVDRLTDEVVTLLSDEGVVVGLFRDGRALLADEGMLQRVLDAAGVQIDGANLAVLSASGVRLMDQMTMVGADLRNLVPELADGLTQLRRLLRSLDEEPEQLLFGPRPRPEEN